jgi:hypothetical protein
MLTISILFGMTRFLRMKPELFSFITANRI